MEKYAWKQWGKRFKELAKEKDETIPTLAEKMGLAQSTLRSWTNGTRQINLADFFWLCETAQVNPSQVLFGGIPMDPETKRHLSALVKEVVEADPTTAPGYSKIAKSMRTKIKG